MKTKGMIIWVLLVLGLGGSGVALAGNTATQTITATVNSVNEIAISGTMGSLNPATPAAGSDFAAITDTNTSYSFSTNASSAARVKVTAVLNSNMPTGTTLQLVATNLTKAGGSGSAGTAQAIGTLTNSAVDLVKDIYRARGSASLSYTYTPTIDAEAQTINRTLTLTLTAQ